MTWLGRRWTRTHLVFGYVALALACALVGLLTATVIDAIEGRADAVKAQATSQSLDAARQARLEAQVEHLTVLELTGNRQRGRLEAELAALSAQLRALGVTPIFTVDGNSQASVRRRASVPPAPHRTVSPAPHPSKHPSPSPRPSPTPSCRLRVGNVCLRR